MRILPLLPMLGVLALHAQTQVNPSALLNQGADQKEPLRVHDQIYQAIGFGNTFLVTTPEGSALIDTSIASIAPRHVKLLRPAVKGPVRYIFITHGHADHIGGVPLWREKGTEVIAHKQHAEFMHYQTRIAGFLRARGAAQFALPMAMPQTWAGNYGAKLVTDVLADDGHEVKLGGLTFRLLHTPGETPDHMTVWIPELKAAFTGDNYYESFPNIYTLRGTQPRWALEYVASLDRVLALKPEVVLPSHGPAIIGNAEVTKRLTKSRDAILYVHDAVVKGMNEGRDVYSLMRDIHLPEQLDVGESYGRLSWSVRGIFEGYAGWFDLNPATLYAQPPESIYADIGKLAGAEAIVKLARQRISEQRLPEALRLTDVALAADSANRPALEARLSALDALVANCRNTNERGWLDYAVRETRRRLGR